MAPRGEPAAAEIVYTVTDAGCEAWLGRHLVAEHAEDADYHRMLVVVSSFTVQEMTIAQVKRHLETSDSEEVLAWVRDKFDAAVAEILRLGYIEPYVPEAVAAPGDAVEAGAQ